MGTVKVTDREGGVHDLSFDNGKKLMEVLREEDMVRAECGGMQICATCHVYIEGNGTDIVGAASEDEADMLDGTGDFEQGRSRLSCQIMLSDDCDGLSLTLAPEL
ncbi:MAG: 2Fe-2S iron-sulfur cluster-binding protein [Parasphingorhabdus sp.]